MRRPASAASPPGYTRVTRQCAQISNSAATRSTPQHARWQCPSMTSPCPGLTWSSHHRTGSNTYASLGVPPNFLRRRRPARLPHPDRSSRRRERRHRDGLRSRGRLRDLQHRNPRARPSARTKQPRSPPSTSTTRLRADVRRPASNPRKWRSASTPRSASATSAASSNTSRRDALPKAAHAKRGVDGSGPSKGIDRLPPGRRPRTNTRLRDVLRVPMTGHHDRSVLGGGVVLERPLIVPPGSFVEGTGSCIACNDCEPALGVSICPDLSFGLTQSRPATAVPRWGAET